MVYGGQIGMNEQGVKVLDDKKGVRPGARLN